MPFWLKVILAHELRSCRGWGGGGLILAAPLRLELARFAGFESHRFGDGICPHVYRTLAHSAN